MVPIATARNDEAALQQTRFRKTTKSVKPTTKYAKQNCGPHVAVDLLEEVVEGLLALWLLSIKLLLHLLIHLHLPGAESNAQAAHKEVIFFVFYGYRHQTCTPYEVGNTCRRHDGMQTVSGTH